MNLAGGTIRTEDLVLAGGAFNWSSGTLRLLNQIHFGPGGLFGANFILGANRTLIGTTLFIGGAGTGSLTIDGNGLAGATAQIHVGGTSPGLLVVNAGATASAASGVVYAFSSGLANGRTG